MVYSSAAKRTDVLLPIATNLEAKPSLAGPEQRVQAVASAATS